MRPVDLHERIEDAGQLVGRDPDAAVGYLDLSDRANALRCELDVASIVRELDRVRDEVEKDLLRLVGVDRDHDVRRDRLNRP